MSGDLRQKRAARALHLIGGVTAEPRRIARRARPLGGETEAAVQRQRLAAEIQAGPRGASAWPAIGVRQEPSRAARKARSQVDGDRRLLMVDGGEERPGSRRRRRDLDADGALRDRRQHLVGIERRGDAVRETQAD